MNEMSRILYMLIFFTIASMILGSIHYYLWIRLVRDSSLALPWRQIATAAIIFAALSLPLAMFFGRALPFDISRYLTFLPFIWMGAMMLLFFYLVATDEIRLVLFLIKKAIGSGPEMMDPGRRLLLARAIAGSAVIVAGGLTATAVFTAARKAVVKAVSIHLQRFPSALDGTKLVQISDLHLGITVGREWLAEVVHRVNQLEPDIIAITGDLVDGFIHQIEDEIAPLADLKAKHGVFFVTGNHEYYFGAEDWIPAIEKLGIRVLRNESVLIGEAEASFYLAGVDDYRARGFAPGHGQDMEKALNGRDLEKAVVLLAHQPLAFSQASELKVDLTLSGHTHGGQIWPFSYIVGLQQGYLKGHYNGENGSQLYVNSGTYLWGPPMRLGTRAEITQVELKRA